MKPSTGNLVMAAVVVVLIGVVGIVLSPSQSGTIATITGGLLVVLYRMLQQDTDNAKLQKDIVAVDAKVNGGLTAPMKIAAVASRKLADAVPTPENHANAEAAEDVLSDHLDALKKPAS